MNQGEFRKLLEEALEPIKQKQEVHSAALMRIESVLEGYADAYKVNKENIERVDTRLTNVGQKMNIEVAEDLKVPHFSSE